MKESRALVVSHNRVARHERILNKRNLVYGVWRRVQGVQGVGFGVWGLGLGVGGWGLGVGVLDFGFWVDP